MSSSRRISPRLLREPSSENAQPQTGGGSASTGLTNDIANSKIAFPADAPASNQRLPEAAYYRANSIGSGAYGGVVVAYVR